MVWSNAPQPAPDPVMRETGGPVDGDVEAAHAGIEHSSNSADVEHYAVGVHVQVRMPCGGVAISRVHRADQRLPAGEVGLEIVVSELSRTSFHSGSVSSRGSPHASSALTHRGCSYR